MALVTTLEGCSRVFTHEDTAILSRQPRILPPGHIALARELGETLIQDRELQRAQPDQKAIRSFGHVVVDPELPYDQQDLSGQ